MVEIISKIIKIWFKLRSSIQSHRQNPNWIEIYDWIWLAWNPNSWQFNAGPLFALAYFKGAPHIIFRRIVLILLMLLTYRYYFFRTTELVFLQEFFQMRPHAGGLQCVPLELVLEEPKLIGKWSRVSVEVTLKLIFANLSQ